MKTIVKFEPEKAHQVYRTSDGKRVPGASTVAKIGDDPAALLQWAWNLGQQGLDYRKVRDNAASAGTLAHWLIECHFAGTEPDLNDFAPNIKSKAETAFIHFLNFWEAEKLNFHLSEVQLVSDAHRFGGTLDMICEDSEGRAILLDFKTSDRIYQSHLSQLAGYEQLWNEHHMERPIWRRAIVRIPKSDDGQFEVRWLSNVDAYWSLFKAQLALYYAQKTTKAAAEQ